MAGYIINRYNGSVATTVADGTVDTTTDIKLIGKNYAGYGEVQNENFVWLLENFSNANPPPKPISGQVWYDSANSKLKFYDSNKWRTTGGAEIGATQPTGLTVGDFWFDTTNKQLYAWNGVDYTLIGPQGVAGSGTTQMRSRSVRDSLGTTHAIIEGIANGNTIFTISADAAFTLDPATSSITGFTTVHQGITLAYSSDDVNYPGQTLPSANHRFWGTATNSDRLGGYAATDFIRSTSAIFSSPVQFNDVGFTVGATPKLRVFNSADTTPTILNQLNDTIVFSVTSNGVVRTPMKLVGTSIVPENDNETSIGSDLKRYSTITAVNFKGVASNASKLALGADFVSASTAATDSTIAARTTSDESINGINITAGALKATYFVGTATAANYADLAEMYLADAEYELGTVLMVGGEKEVTACQWGKRAIGAVSANPAYLMNKDLEGGTIVALKGRIPVKVTGRVKKGDELIASNDGAAVTGVPHSSGVFAIALESSDDIGVKLVECLIL
jgi:hypothetical protein